MSLKFKIEKSVPIPETNSIKDILDSMDIYDSIFTENRKDRARIATACWQLNKINGKEFLSRKVNQENEKGWRIWRTK